MSNTKVTITYANGSTREFIASDDLEQLIDKGCMFSVTTMHSDMSIDEEVAVSKMYAGNPISAMGNMVIMRSNAEKIMKDGDEKMNIVIETLNACIQLMSNEITSHQSNMSPVDDIQSKPRQFRKGEPLVPDLKLVENDAETEEPMSSCGHSTVLSICALESNPNCGKKCVTCDDFVPF